MAKCADSLTNSLNSSSVENFILNYKMMKPLDEALRCRICFDYFNNCMMTKCSHNYCSICIRRYMMYKSQCPTCFQDAFEPELRSNRLVDEILRLYKKLRDLDENSAYAIKSEDDSSKTVYVGELHKESKAVAEAQSSSSSRESFTPRIKIEIPDMEKSLIDSCKVSVTRDPDFNEVTCPVCYKTVSSDRINAHLDICLKQQFSDEPERDRKKTLPKLVYHLLSEKEIKLKLKEHGLSVSGSRQALIRRHKNFITLYNANCDSLNPKPVSDLVREIELQEIEERINSLPKQMQINKKSDLSVIEEQNKSYVKKHLSQYSALINDVHHREIAQNKMRQEKGNDETFIENYAQIQIKQEKEDEPLVENSDDENYTSVIEHNPDLCDDKIAAIKHPNLDTKNYKDDCSDTSTSSSEDEMQTRSAAINFHRKRKKASVSSKNPESPKKK